MTFPSALGFAFAGLMAIMALTVAFSWLIARLWCTPRGHAPSKGPADYKLPYEPIQFSSGQVPVRGWFIPPISKSPPRPAVILAHGWSKNAADMLPAAWVLHRADIAVVLYDARGHGVSGRDGPITILKFAQDILACLNYLDTRADVDHGRIGVLGHSMGGSGALLAASMDLRVRAAVSCSAFADPRAITADFLRRMHIPVWPFLPLVSRFIERWLGTDMETVAPQGRIARIAAPLLLLHGDDDRFIPAKHVQALYASSARDRTQLRRLPGRRHADVTRDGECGDAIVAFFRTHLSGASRHCFQPNKTGDAA